MFITKTQRRVVVGLLSSVFFVVLFVLGSFPNPVASEPLNEQASSLPENQATQQSQFSPQGLTTRWDGTSFGRAGNMFDVEATGTTVVTINSFDINIHSTTSEMVEIYYVTGGGSYVGNETNPAAWTSLYSGTVTGLGTGIPTTINLSTPLTLQPPPSDNSGSRGDIYGIYVTLSTGESDLAYTVTSQDDYDNEDLTLTSTLAIQYPFGPGTSSNRVWNGTINYNTSCNAEPHKAGAPTSIGAGGGAYAGGLPDPENPGTQAFCSQLYLWGDTVVDPAMEVNIEMSHSWIGDLAMYMFAPDGTNITLMHRPQGDFDNPPDIGGMGSGDDSDFGNPAMITFTDSGSNPELIGTGLGDNGVVLGGTFAPTRDNGAFDGNSVNSFADWAGMPVTGTWWLCVTDFVSGDSGMLDGWTINVDPNANSRACAVPVTLASFEAEREGSTTIFEWSTATEAGNLGHNIYVETANGRQKN